MQPCYGEILHDPVPGGNGQWGDKHGDADYHGGHYYCPTGLTWAKNPRCDLQHELKLCRSETGFENGVEGGEKVYDICGKFWVRGKGVGKGWRGGRDANAPHMEQYLPLPRSSTEQ